MNNNKKIIGLHGVPLKHGDIFSPKNLHGGQTF